MAAGGAAAQAVDPPGGEKGLTDLLHLLDIPVISASNTREKLSEAPATMVVLTRQDFEDRGYTELSQILDDLPGMDLARSYGADYLKNYWRGYRNDIGEPFLVMIDGLPFNHLWYNTADTPLVTYPLSAIQRVEVVYGPASSVYGANAFMGVINILTRRDPGEGNTALRGTLSAGSFATRIADVQALQRIGEAVFSLALRSDKGNVDGASFERYEYTRSRYYGDRTLWGSTIVEDPRLGGSARSEHQHHAIDARLQVGATEFAFQQLWISSGYGSAYAADASQSIGRWIRPDTSVHIRHSFELGDQVHATLLVRHRQSDLDRNSYDVESFHGYGAGNQSVVTYYEVLNNSLSATQDFDITFTPRFAMNAGLTVESKTLQKAYNTLTNGERPSGAISDTNHFSTQDRGFYAQARHRLGDSSILNLGLRSDTNSVYGTANTLRGGYVGSFGPWGVKALYGQAYQEPTARLLYGATTGTGANANLQPERSNTVEVSGSYARPSFTAFLSLYRVNNSKKIQKIDGLVVNSGDQQVVGADLSAQFIISTAFLREWKVWGFYSHIFKAEDRAYANGIQTATRSGDLADHKLWLGSTLSFSSRLNATLLGRFIGSRTTVQSNPIREVDSYGSLDLSLQAKDFGWKGLCFGLRATNLLDRATFHPGLRDAGAGTTPGAFSPQGIWQGSNSYYNSLLPQPGRAITFTLGFTF
jgi:outer membrane cobalamin receptor